MLQHSHPLLTQPGRRICVVGTSGSGKTSVAQALARILDVPYVSSDALIWGPNWALVPPEDRAPIFDEATRGDAWAMDGNISQTRVDGAIMLERCDTIVWLDLPLREVLWQVTTRTLRRMVTRERLWHGNIEPWYRVFTHDSVILWALQTHARNRRRYARVFEQQRESGRALIRLGSRAKTDAWLASLSAARVEEA